MKQQPRRMQSRQRRSLTTPVPAVILVLGGVLAALAGCGAPQAGPFDLVIAGGRVMDPETGLDGVRWLGIRDGVIQAMSTTPLEGRDQMEAAGLVVAPGFIDLHAHGQDDANYRLFALNGVTAALEMEVGAADVAGWYRERAGGTLIHHGVTVGHIPVRIAQYEDPGEFLPSGAGGYSVAGDEGIARIRDAVRQGLEEGALGVGMGLQYTPGATRWEVLEIFREAADHGAPVFVHPRGFGVDEPGGSVESFLEVLGAAALTGAPLHIAHLNSMSLSETPRTLRMVEEAVARGWDVSTEAYPYSAGMTSIQSALLDQYEGASDEFLANLQWPATGERLNQESFRRYRAQGGSVVLHLNTPEMEAMAIEHPLTAIASDGGLRDGIGHPRTAGTYARVLSHYVREEGTLGLMEALGKMSLLPARRLEGWAPAFGNKGRIREGADADLVVFDPGTVADRATYSEPGIPAVGFRHVLVAGVPVVRDGEVVEGVLPGQGLKGGR